MFDIQNYQFKQQQLAAESKDLDKIIKQLKNQLNKKSVNDEAPTRYSQLKMLRKSYTFKLPPAVHKMKDHELMKTSESDDIIYFGSDSMGYVNEEYFVKNETRRRMQRATEMGNLWMKDKTKSSSYINKPNSPTEKEITLEEIRQRRSTANELSKKWYKLYFEGSIKEESNELDLQDDEINSMNGIYGISTLMNIHNEVILEANKTELVDNITESQSNTPILTTFNNISESSSQVNNHENEINELLNVIIADTVKQSDFKEKGIDRLRKRQILETFQKPSIVQNSTLKNNSKYYRQFNKSIIAVTEKLTNVRSLLKDSKTTIQ